MTELEKLEQAKICIDKLANGINPLNDEPLDENDIVNQVKISRCLFYVSDVLGRAMQTSAEPPSTRYRRKSFFLTQEQVAAFPFSDTAIALSEIIKRLNETADLSLCKKLKYSHIANRLIELGLLNRFEEDGKNELHPTPQGIELGIARETRQGYSGEYSAIFYNREAQQFILDNLEALSKRPMAPAGQWKEWTAEEKARLADMYQKGATVEEMADALQRTAGGIRKRLKYLGLTKDKI